MLIANGCQLTADFGEAVFDKMEGGVYDWRAMDVFEEAAFQSNVEPLTMLIFFAPAESQVL